MKFCQDHWDKLRQAIKDLGLWHLVAADGEAAMENMQAELAGTSTKENHDPLMSCFWMISGRALEMGGLYLMSSDVCPICEAIKHRANVVDEKLGRAFTAQEEERYWIDGPADAELAYCREQGLAPGQQ